jgi:glycerol uptake facilitator-like aquaporin
MEAQMTFMEMIKFSSSKLILEFFATGVLTMLFITGKVGVLLIGLWILTIFCWKISSAQLNPAVTLAFMLRRDTKRVHVPMGVLLICAQVAGAWAGAWLMAFFAWTTQAMVPISNATIFAAMW